MIYIAVNLTPRAFTHQLRSGVLRNKYNWFFDEKAIFCDVFACKETT